jgi:hypothetical protein
MIRAGGTHGGHRRLCESGGDANSGHRSGPAEPQWTTRPHAKQIGLIDRTNTH